MSNNRRDAIRMTDDEVVAFIEEQKSLQVGTLERDGSIHLSTLWFAVVDGRIVFETYTRSQKIRNLERTRGSPCCSRTARSMRRSGA